MYVDLPTSECMDGDDRQADSKDMHVRSYAYTYLTNKDTAYYSSCTYIYTWRASCAYKTTPGEYRNNLSSLLGGLTDAAQQCAVYRSPTAHIHLCNTAYQYCITVSI